VGCENLRSGISSITTDFDAREDDELCWLARFIRDNVWISLVSGPDIDVAFQIFVTTNRLGRPLSSADILKANLFAGMASATQGPMRDRWATAEQELGRDLESLPGYLRAIYGRNHAPTFREVEILCENLGGPQRFVEDIFFPCADALRVILGARHEGAVTSPAINVILRRLNWQRARDWVAPIIAFMQTYRDRPDLLLSFLSAYERLVFGMVVLGVGGNKRERRYRDVIDATSARQPLARPGSPLLLMPEEQSNILYAVRTDLYTRDSRTCRLVLKCISNSLPGDISPPRLENLSIEHVLPQNIPRNSSWRDCFNEAEHAHCVKLLGNLVLVPPEQNTGAGNLDFPTKHDIFFPQGKLSENAITNQIHGLASWSPENVRKRDALLIERLCEIWGLSALSGAASMHRKRVVYKSPNPDQ
jgi:hypothetical protein